MNLRIQLLGGFHIRTATGEAVAIHQPRLQLLLAYLLLHRTAPQSRSHVAFLFWPDSTEKQARTNLRKLLHTLRGLLPALEDYLHLTTETVEWRTDAAYILDVAAFEDALTAPPRDHPTQRRVHLEQAVAHYTGPLLPGHYDDWLLVIREELHLCFVNALTELAAICEAQGDLEAALAHGQRLLHADPLQESTYRTLMRLHLALGEPAGALRVYHRCATMLEEELGVTPSADTQALYGQLRQAEARGAGSDVTAARQARADPSVPLVGRVDEWQALRRVWHGVQQGGATLVVIQGEAGVGKTRLAEEIVDLAYKQGCATLQARAYAAEGGTAYSPVADLLQDVSTRPALRSLEPLWQVELARIVPDLAGDDLPPMTPMIEAWQQRRFHEALVRGCLAVGQPLVLHLDDLQWFDQETLAWLHFLLRFDDAAQLLVVGTLRLEEIAAEHPYHALRHALLQSGALHEVTLEALTAEAVSELATTLVGEALSQQHAAALYRATEGNPLFVLETLRALPGLPASDEKNGRAGHLTAVDLTRLTPKVQAVIQTRLAQLAPSTRVVLQSAAVIGRQFTFELLRAVEPFHGGSDPPADPEAALIYALDELWQRRIIREHGPNAYDFGHDRIRETVYAEISPVLRPHIHARAAAALETLHAENLAPVSSRIAVHCEAAGKSSLAAGYYAQAARYAAERFANEEAARYLRRALALTPDTERLAHCELRTRLEGILELSGTSAERYDNLQRLAQIAADLQREAEATGAAREEIEAALARRAAVAIRLARHFSSSGEMDACGVAANQAIHLAQAAQARPLLAEAHGTLGWYYHWMGGELEAASRELTRAVELAHTLGMDELEATCLEQLAATGMYSGMPIAEILEHLRAAFAIHQARGNVYYQASLLNKFGYAAPAQGEGDFYEAIDYYRKGLEMAQRVGAIPMTANILNNLGGVCTLIGDYKQADIHIQAGIRTARQSGTLFHEAMGLAFLAELRANQGRLDEACDYALASLQRFDSIGSEHRRTEPLSYLGFVEYMREDYAQALEYLEEAIEMARSRSNSRFEATALTRLGHVYLALGRLAEAGAVYGEAYALRRSLQQYRRSLEPLVGLAQVAWREGRREDAHHLVQTVFEQLQESPLDYTEEGFLVYRSCYQLLQDLGDLQSGEARRLAHEHLEVRCRALEDESARRAFRATPLYRSIYTASD